MSGRETTSRGGEPELKRRRLLDAGGPVEDDETARQKMREAKVGEPGGEMTGFDPDNIDGLKTPDGTPYRVYEMSAMGYFSREGDLPMMRWLYVKGADTRDENVKLHFPMYLAAVRGHTGVCEWLHGHGAAQDVKRTTRTSTGTTHRLGSPLSFTFHRYELSLPHITRAAPADLYPLSGL